jgi:hypothetical protein
MLSSKQKKNILWKEARSKFGRATIRHQDRFPLFLDQRRQLNNKLNCPKNNPLEKNITIKSYKVNKDTQQCEDLVGIQFRMNSVNCSSTSINGACSVQCTWMNPLLKYSQRTSNPPGQSPKSPKPLKMPKQTEKSNPKPPRKPQTEEQKRYQRRRRQHNLRRNKKLNRVTVTIQRK